jgi:hypothetical protein
VSFKCNPGAPLLHNGDEAPGPPTPPGAVSVVVLEAYTQHHLGDGRGGSGGSGGGSGG